MTEAKDAIASRAESLSPGDGSPVTVERELEASAVSPPGEVSPTEIASGSGHGEAPPEDAWRAVLRATGTADGW